MHTHGVDLLKIWNKQTDIHRMLRTMTLLDTNKLDTK